jgi:integrase
LERVGLKVAVNAWSNEGATSVLTFFPVYGSGAVRPAIASSRPRAKESGLVGSKSALSDSDDEIHPFAPDEVERIVDAAQGWEKSLVALYFFTGLRRGEGLGLTWNNVFPDDGNLIVTHSVGRYGRTKPKTTASRRKVQFGPRVLAELLAQLKRRVNLLQWQMEALHISALPSSPAIARSLTIPGIYSDSSAWQYTISGLLDQYGDEPTNQLCAEKFGPES